MRYCDHAQDDECARAQCHEENYHEPMNRPDIMTEAAARFDDWLGKTESLSQSIGPDPARGLAALLDRPETPVAPGAPLPALWHWCYFLETTPQREIAVDGHARKGGFLPPIDLPRRMWAGSRFRFHHPLRIGESVTRHSRIENIEYKQGRSGQLAFVQVAHEYRSPAGLAFSEQHDIVYRQSRPGADQGGSGKGPAQTARDPLPEPDFSREYQADAIVLFRYSALTFNAHRIHYDRDYVREVEGYPNLLVHGPLLATLLLDELHCHYPGRALREFAFRALAPVFDSDTFRLCGRNPGADGRVPLWVAKAEGTPCIQGEARLTP